MVLAERRQASGAASARRVRFHAIQREDKVRRKNSEGSHPPLAEFKKASGVASARRVRFPATQREDKAQSKNLGGCTPSARRNQNVNDATRIPGKVLGSDVSVLIETQFCRDRIALIEQDRYRSRGRGELGSSGILRCRSQTALLAIHQYKHMG
jgi:hypothetical protein